MQLLMGLTQQGKVQDQYHLCLPFDVINRLKDNKTALQSCMNMWQADSLMPPLSVAVMVNIFSGAIPVWRQLCVASYR